jgi:ribosomal protein L11 methylase PrmA
LWRAPITCYTPSPMIREPSEVGRLSPWRDTANIDETRARELAGRLELRGRAEDEAGAREEYLRLLDVRSGEHVLDVGCGSGVLAVTACVLGAGSATAIDISPAAPPVAMANAEANGVGAHVDASTTPLPEIDGPFDIVLANVLAPTLIGLATDLQRVLADDGALVVSGVLADRHDHVLAALAPLRAVERRRKEGWIALTLRP